MLLRCPDCPDLPDPWAPDESGSLLAVAAVGDPSIYVNLRKEKPPVIPFSLDDISGEEATRTWEDEHGNTLMAHDTGPLVAIRMITRSPWSRSSIESWFGPVELTGKGDGLSEATENAIVLFNKIQSTAPCRSAER